VQTGGMAERLLLSLPWMVETRARPFPRGLPIPAMD
jgi:hypothetical protein